MIRRWWGQLKAVWDTAGQLVELSERLEALNTVQGEQLAMITRIDERTRKQVYREGKVAENATWEAARHNPADPGGVRAQILARARAQGVPV